MSGQELGQQPAFPSDPFVNPNGNIDWGAPGLTKREEFAKAAMQGLIIACPSWYSHQIATNAVNQADELLDKLAKGMS